MRAPRPRSHTPKEAQCHRPAQDVTARQRRGRHHDSLNQHQQHCTHFIPLRHGVRPRRRHQPLCNVQVPIRTCQQKRSIALLRENAAHQDSESRTSTTAAPHTHCSSPSLHSTPPTTPATVRPPSILSHTQPEAMCYRPARHVHTTIKT